MITLDFSKPCHIYFMGIGGISMSGLAEVLLSKGFQVSGSDSKESPLTLSLKEKGAQIYIGQKAENITHNIDVVVYTAAIRSDNPEFIAMKNYNLPSLTRAELLGQMMKNYELPIAISGTHGKTTTTSMISEILMQADLDPTLSIGGMLKSIGGNIRIGNSEYFVTEACEYTNSFLSFFPKYACILNVEEDHLDFFKDLQDIYHSFHEFAKLLPSDGTLIINGEIEHIEELTKDLDCLVLTFGKNASSYDYVPSDITYDSMGNASFTLIKNNIPSENYSLSVPGDHNILNALAAIAIADILGISHEVTQKALKNFKGTDRRFEYKGTRNGVTIIDDYAHHPSEITATLNASVNYPHQKLWCVFQPHTYTRTKAFMKDFAKALSLADEVILADIYAAREKDTLGISSKDLQNEILKLDKKCSYFPSFEEIENFIINNCSPGDMLITMGAGDVVNIGESLLKR